jgi:hypothetical protein
MAGDGRGIRVATGETLKNCVPAALFVLLAAASLTHSAGNSFAAAAQAGQANAAFTQDKGKLRILQNGAEAGTEQFELAPSGNAWIARGETTVRIPGGAETRSTGQLRMTADGTPLHYDWTAQGSTKASGTVEFENGTAKTSVNLGKQPVLQDFRFPSPRVAVLDNNLYDQYCILGRLYDWNAKGTQTFPVLIPQDTTPGTVSLESLGSKTINGADLQGLRVRSADLEIEVYFDARHRLMRLEVPEAMVVVVRE